MERNRTNHKKEMQYIIIIMHTYICVCVHAYKQMYNNRMKQEIGWDDCVEFVSDSRYYMCRNNHINIVCVCSRFFGRQS